MGQRKCDVRLGNSIQAPTYDLRRSSGISCRAVLHCHIVTHFAPHGKPTAIRLDELHPESPWVGGWHGNLSKRLHTL